MIPKIIIVVLAAFTLIYGPMLLWSAPASAVIVHKYEREINGKGTPAESFRPFGVAVDNSTGASGGDVYVADLEHGVVDKFGPLGEYKSQLTGFSIPLGAHGVAIDNSTSLTAEGGVYSADQGNGNLYRGESIFASGLIGATGVAVNQTTGEVYVARGEDEEDRAGKLVYKFNSTGKLSPLEGPPPEGFRDAYAVAVDNTCYYSGLTGSACASTDSSNEDVYVLDNGNSVVDKFEANGKFLLKWSAEGYGLAVDQSNGHVYVANSNKDLIEEFDSSGKLLSEIGKHSPDYPKGRESEFGPLSVAVDRATGDVYVGDVANRAVDVFGPDIESPEAFTGPFSDLQSMSVTLEGEVNPKGNDTTSFFEYGPCEQQGCSESDPYSLTKPTVQSSKGPSPGSSDDGSGVTNVPVEASVTDLSSVPNQAYHYRLKAENTEIGASPPGEEREFKTLAVPPEVENLPPSLVGFETAVLRGSVNPENSQTSYQFEYGMCEKPSTCATSGYTGKTPMQESAIYGPLSVLQEIESLRPASTYHYRLVAENPACPKDEKHPCPVPGSEDLFTTEPAPVLAVATGSANSVTQTSAVISGTVTPNGLASSYGFQLGTEAGAYGPAIGLGRLEAGIYEVARTVTLALNNLLPGITYHYRLTASTAYASLAGTDRTLTTTGVTSPFTQPVALSLLASPPISFPVEAKVGSRVLKKCKRAYKRDKRGKCVRAKTKRKVRKIRKSKGTGARVRQMGVRAKGK